MEQVALVSIPAVAFLLFAGGAFVTRPRSVGNAPYIRAAQTRMLGQHRSQIEDINVHFRRRKQQIAEPEPGSVTVFRPGTPVEAPSAPVAEESLPPSSSFAAAPAPAPAPAPEVPLVTPIAQSPLVNIPLRSQVTGSDSRADRLVRHVRNEVEALKKTLDDISSDRDELLELDLDALLADPEHALTLPPAVLVRALVELGEENRRLEKRGARQREKAAKVTRKLRDLEREDAGRRARLASFEEVLAALHANLEDLRYERDHVRLGAPAAPQALRPGAGQLPQASTALGIRD